VTTDVVTKQRPSGALGRLARESGESPLSLVASYGFLLVLVVFALAPIAWAMMTSLKDLGDIYSGRIWPDQPNLVQYRRLFEETGFLRWMGNSLVVAASSTVLGVFVSLLAGFAFAKYEFPLKRLLFVIVIASIAIPPFATVIPMFGWMSRIGWIDTYQILILPFAANAFGVFLMTQYMRGVPNELLDSGRIDGCNELMLLPRIVLPIVRPAIGATGVLLFLNAWNSFIWPLVMTRSNPMYTLPVGLATLKGVQFVEYGMLMAGAILSIAPMIVLFLLLHRQFIDGLTQGAVKG
jgi:ABC-type glycerol-3-phosphate transport system permease component